MIDKKYGIFYEPQSGGLCRLHSLNAFFGRKKISPITFTQYISEYNTYIRQRFNVNTSSASFDLVSSDQSNLVAFILKKHRIHARYYALNSLYGKSLSTEITTAPFVFVYNGTHIWGVMLKNNKHYKVDSIGGVQPFLINSLCSMRDVGIMVPVPLKSEWYRQVDIIVDILKQERIRTKVELIEYLTKLHRNKKILDKLEIPLGVSMSILETNLLGCESNNDAVFVSIRRLITRYNLFIRTFTDGNYTNLALIVKYVPDLIIDVCSLR